MKVLRSLLVLTALAVVVPPAIAAEKKAAKKEGAAPAAEAKKSDAKPKAEAKSDDASKAGRPIAMSARVDNLDAANKTFTMKRKDGYEVKHIVTDKTDIKNNGAAAKFEDIKMGDTVSGSRIKKSETEYEVVKITKFGVAAPKEKKAKEGDAAKKSEEKKKE